MPTVGEREEFARADGQWGLKVTIDLQADIVAAVGAIVQRHIELSELQLKIVVAWHRNRREHWLDGQSQVGGIREQQGQLVAVYSKLAKVELLMNDTASPYFIEQLVDNIEDKATPMPMLLEKVATG